MRDTRRVLALVALTVLVTQFCAATWLTPVFGTPNASTAIAERLVATGAYEAFAWPRTATTPDGTEAPLRAYLLPAEPLYLAAAFRWLPSTLWPYLHLPVVLVFVLAIAATGVAVGGARLGLTAGLLAALDPFVLYHGPVWDDVFLASAVEWSVLACLCWAATDRACCASLTRPGWLVLLGLAAAVAALARAPAQFVIAGMAMLALVHPRLRALRPIGVVLLTGVVVAVLAWGARNHVVLGEFFVGTSHDGITLLESTSPAARASILATGTAEGFASRALAEHYAAIRPMSELEANRYLQRAAWRQMADAPLATMITAGVKLIVSVSGVDFGRPLIHPRNLAAAGFSLTLTALAVAGLPRLRGRGAARPAVLFGWSAAAMAAVTLAMLALGPVGIRYRLTLTGVAYLAASAWWSMRRPAVPNDIAAS